jgi:hypothetical protein
VSEIQNKFSRALQIRHAIAGRFFDGAFVVSEFPVVRVFLQFKGWIERGRTALGWGNFEVIYGRLKFEF